MRRATTATVPGDTPLMRKRPSAPLCAPKRVPSTTTETPVSGCLLRASVITPESVEPAACACASLRGTTIVHIHSTATHACARAVLVRSRISLVAIPRSSRLVWCVSDAVLLSGSRGPPRGTAYNSPRLGAGMPAVVHHLDAVNQ